MRGAVLSALFVSACGSSPAAPVANTTAADVPTTAARFVGVVTNEDGAALPGATVVVTYVPDTGQAQTVSTLTGTDGRYELQLSAREPGNVNALIVATAGADYVPNEQLVRVSAATERNLRLRRVRTIGAGQSTTVRFDADSSRCRIPRTEGICESLRIQFPNEWVYRLVVKVSADGDGVVPTLITYGITGQGVVSLPIGDNEFWDPRVPRFEEVTISIPDATMPQRYEVLVYAAP